jgi:hypothetical protein
MKKSLFVVASIFCLGCRKGIRWVGIPLGFLVLGALGVLYTHGLNTLLVDFDVVRIFGYGIIG